MQYRELLFKYRIFLGGSTLEEFLHRRLCTFALMCHLVHVGINTGSFSEAGTDACRNASLQQSEVPELAKKNPKTTKIKHYKGKIRKLILFSGKFLRNSISASHNRVQI